MSWTSAWPPCALWLSSGWEVRSTRRLHARRQFFMAPAVGKGHWEVWSHFRFYSNVADVSSLSSFTIASWSIVFSLSSRSHIIMFISFSKKVSLSPMQVNRMLRVLLIIAVSKNCFIVREETEKCIKHHLVFSVNFILARTHTLTHTQQPPWSMQRNTMQSKCLYFPSPSCGERVNTSRNEKKD